MSVGIEATSQEGGLAGVAPRRIAVAGLGWGSGAGMRFETWKRAVAAGPRFPAPSTALTDSVTVAPGANSTSRSSISTRSPTAPAIGIRSRGNGRPSIATKNPSVPAGPESRGVTHEIIASPAGSWVVWDATLRPLGAAGG